MEITITSTFILHIIFVIKICSRGVQKIINHLQPYKPDPTTVQGILEIAIEKLRPVNNIHVVPSSR